MKNLINNLKNKVVKERVAKEELEALLDSLKDVKHTDKETINKIIKTAAKRYRVSTKDNNLIQTLNREMYFDDVNYTLIYRVYWHHDATLEIVETL